MPEIPTFTSHLECSATGERYEADVLDISRPIDCAMIERTTRRQ